jgi:hypothetical protein
MPQAHVLPEAEPAEARAEHSSECEKMSNRSPFTQDYLSRLRAMDAAFKAEMLEACPADERHFANPLLRRPRNPHNTDATDTLRRAILTNDLQQNQKPGLRLKTESLNSEKRQILVQTPAMLAARRALIVFKDHSAIYVEDLTDRPNINLRALPTPLCLRGSNQCIRTGEKRQISSASSTRNIKRVRLLFGQETLHDGLWLAGGSGSDTPRPSEWTDRWVEQLDLEVEALSRRLARLSPYQMRTTPIISAAGRLIPDGGHLNSGSAPQATAFMLRHQVCDDDAHLGLIGFDPKDDRLLLLHQALHCAASVVRSKWQATEGEFSLAVRIEAPNPTEDRAFLTVLTRSDLDPDHIRADILDELGPDVIEMASRYYAVSLHAHVAGQQFYAIPIARVHIDGDALSMHEAYKCKAELGDLQERIRAILGEPACNTVTNIAPGSHAVPRA